MSENKRRAFGQQDLRDAVNALSTMRYFPSEGRAAVIVELAKMCPHLEALEWLVSEAVGKISDWPGLAELRGLLCTRYDTADGIDRYCSLLGYSAEEQEAKYLARHDAVKSLSPSAPMREVLALPAGRAPADDTKESANYPFEAGKKTPQKAKVSA